MISPTASSIRALLPTYINYLRGLGCTERGATSYAWCVRRFADWLDPAAVPADISARMISAYQSDMAARGLKPRTIGVALSAIRRFCCWLQLMEVLNSDPTARIKWPHLPRSLPRGLTPDQRVLLEQALAEIPDGDARNVRYFFRNRVVILLMLLAGLRIAEVANLRWEHVDLDNAILRVHQGKGLRDRELPLHPVLADALESIAPALRGTYVCGHKNGDQIESRSMAHVFARWLTWRGGPKITAHQLRHEFAQSLRRTGADLETIRAALGHTDLSTTSVYLGDSVDEVRKAVAKLPAPRAKKRPRADGDEQEGGA